MIKNILDFLTKDKNKLKFNIFLIFFLSVIFFSYFKISTKNNIEIIELPFNHNTEGVFHNYNGYFQVMKIQDYSLSKVSIEDLIKGTSIFDEKYNQLVPWQENNQYEKRGDILALEDYKNDEIKNFDLNGNHLKRFDNREIMKVADNIIFEEVIGDTISSVHLVNNNGEIIKKIGDNLNIHESNLQNYSSSRSYILVKNRYLLLSGANHENKHRIYKYDIKTNELIETPYSNVLTNFFNGHAIAIKHDNDKRIYTLIDEKFNLILDKNYSYMKFASNKNYLIIGNKDSEGKASFGIYTTKGKEVFPIKYEYIDINNDEIIFYKEKDTEDYINIVQFKDEFNLRGEVIDDRISEYRYKFNGYLADKKGNILFEFGNADKYFMVSDFIVKSGTLSDEVDSLNRKKNNYNYENYTSEEYDYGYKERGGEILYYDKKLAKLITLVKPDFQVPISVENDSFLNESIAYYSSNKYYLIRKKS